MMSDRKLLPVEKCLRIKTPCPICGGQLTVKCGDAWEEDNGDWIATEIDIDCLTEPDVESDEWIQWHNWHYRQPYVDWLPIELKVLQEFQRKFRFDIK